MIPHAAVLAVGLSVALGSAGCARTAVPAAAIVEFTGPTMGRTFSVKVVPGPGGLATADRAAIDQDIRGQLAHIDQQLSTWRVDSMLSGFNASTTLEPVPVDEMTFGIFREAVDLGAFTGGALDVTIGPLIDAWGFGPNGQADVAPTDESLVELAGGLGVGQLELDAAALTVRKRDARVRCDFSALAAGYAADLVASRLEQRGLRNFLVDMGGELVARGHDAAGHPWQIAVERPRALRRAAARVVPLTDMAIATSGDDRDYREIDGVRMTHILDPRTRRPVAHRLAAVTVIDRLGVRADALATALMVMGPDEGLAFAERHRLAALLLVPDDKGEYRERASSAFTAWMARM